MRVTMHHPDSGVTQQASADAYERVWSLQGWILVEDTAAPVELPPPPPRRGPGSGIDAWAAYAAACGVEVPDGYGRDQVREMLALAGIPT